MTTSANVTARLDIFERCALEGRRVAHRQTKIFARHYERAYHLSKATGVYQEYCREMSNAEAIRRLTEALRLARAEYVKGYQGAIVNTAASRVGIIEIRAALLCERLARARDAKLARSFLRTPVTVQSYGSAGFIPRVSYSEAAE